MLPNISKTLVIKKVSLMTTALEIQHHSQATKGSQFFKVCKSLKFAELKVQTASTLCTID